MSFWDKYKALADRGSKQEAGTGAEPASTWEEQISDLADAINEADAIMIGAGAGLSTAAGFTYSGERFDRYFFDFAEEYGITDMYSGGFYPFPEKEIFWAWWARHIYYNRYVPAPLPVYEELLELVQDKDYFLLTTNVDHMFQKAGFDKKRLFYTQGDYGLFQSVNPQICQTFDNEEWVMQAMSEQGLVLDETGIFQPGETLSMRIPTELIPVCPVDGSDMTTNLRADMSFVEDAGWHAAAERYEAFLARVQGKRILYLDLGTGMNTPTIIKYNFWRRVYREPQSRYACVNLGEAITHDELRDRSICIDSDILAVTNALRNRL